jgi:hypothetical protein
MKIDIHPDRTTIATDPEEPLNIRWVMHEKVITVQPETITVHVRGGHPVDISVLVEHYLKTA